MMIVVMIKMTMSIIIIILLLHHRQIYGDCDDGYDDDKSCSFDG